MNPPDSNPPRRGADSLSMDGLFAGSSMPPHIVQFYESEDFLADAVARFLGAGLEAGELPVIIATEPHRRAFSKLLEARGFEVEGTGRLTLLDASETLSGFMVDSMPDWERFQTLMGSVFQKRAAGSGSQRIRLYVEMVDVLWKQGNPRAAIRLEEFWNELGKSWSLSLLCGCVMRNFSGEAHSRPFLQICESHTHVIPTERYSQTCDTDIRLREVSLLQQRAWALETEIQRRKGLEDQLQVALEEARRHQEDLQDFLENGAECLHWVGPDGTILWANRAELELLGYSRDEYIGHHIAEFHVDPDVIRDILTRLGHNETLRDCEARLRCKDGSIKHVLISSNVRWEDGQFRHTRCFTRDNTARKHAQDALVRLQALTARLSEARTPEEVIDAIVNPEGGTLEAPFRSVFLLSEEGHHLELARAVGHTPEFLERYARIPLEASLPVTEAVRQSAPVFLSSLREDARDPELREAIDPARVESLACIPLMVEGRAIGAVCFGFGEQRTFGTEERAFCSALANPCAQSLQRARLYEEARQANRRKDEFLAMLGHELRNPLAPILTALQVMQLRCEGRSREQEIIERQVRHMVRLVDDLLDVSRITRGKVELRKEPIELAHVLAKAVELAGPLCEQRLHHLSVDVPQEGLPVHADPMRMAQVLGNLLTNAAKYTEPGGRIAVTASREGDEVIVSVKDNGSGIAPELLPKVFELFVQGERTMDRSQGGLGIGLTVARSLVELHGGTIRVHSPGPGLGSEFVVRLPVLTGQAAPQQDSERAGTGAAVVSRSGVRVLIADDNKDAADLLADALQGAGHEVAVARDGLQALSLAPGFRPDVALLDIGLPELDGYALARKLREQGAGRRLRLVAVTGYGQGSDEARSQEAGFDFHMVKPVDLHAILALVGSVAAQRDSPLAG